MNNDVLEESKSPWPARLLMVAVVLAVGLLASALGYAFFQSGERADRNETAVIALCAFRADLERRADDTERFLADLRAGRRRPIPGITNADLQRSVTAQRSTLKTLVILECEP